ncbi:MAG: hypothetical protein LBU85_10565 [Treponema sp.]|jgi:hypothetical protein|nr:hypothetical protein [Treponema sp.]
MFWNNFGFRKLIDNWLIFFKINIPTKLSSVQKILIGILLLGVIGSVSLMFNGIQNIIIFIVEKALLQRHLNNPAKWTTLLQVFAFLSIFSCLSLIVTVLFAKISSVKLLLVKILFLFSGMAMTLLLHTDGALHANTIPITSEMKIIYIFFSFLIWSFLLFKYNILEKIYSDKKSKKLLVTSIVLSIATVYYWRFVIWDYEQINFLNTLIAIISFFVICLFHYYWLAFLYKLCNHFIKTFEKAEKIYITIISIIIIILIIITFSITSIFYEPTVNGKIIQFDVLYNFDSPNHIVTNVYANIKAAENNDIRQPLFGVFALPFGIISFIFSKIFFFLPGSYAMIITIIQAILLQICIILLGRIIGLRGITSIVFYLFMMFSYPCLIFSFAPEQYIFPVFWLILLLYTCHINFYADDENSYTILYLAATGSLITNVISFPYVFNRKGLKLVKTIGITGIIFIAAHIIFGRTNILLHSISSIKNLLHGFSGESLGFENKVLQYFNFISLCFVKSSISLDNTIGYVTYQLAPVSELNSLGVGLIALVTVSFIMNFNRKFAQFCIFWVAYSFLILCVIGWGTNENGLILYTLYFGWALICLVFMGIEKILNKFPAIKHIIYVCFAILLICVNIPAINDIIRFGIMYYPVKL